ncbi:hypothetical protein SFR_2768 [Streptomyces sp. FR-008]|nr:hypothetical protein SFR_2768 [Streptomyces sp. FR-008]
MFRCPDTSSGPLDDPPSPSPAPGAQHRPAYPRPTGADGSP